jgi:nucleoside-triphosphatase
VGVAALRRAIQEYPVVVIDEIGKMELFSEAFRQAVLEALESGKKVLGTIMLKPHPWADEIKRRPEVNLVWLSRDNRQQVLIQTRSWLRELGGSG